MSFQSPSLYERVLDNRLKEVNETIQSWPSSHKGKVSDGFHTFDELYDHRIALYIALAGYENQEHGGRHVWRTLRHSDGELAFGGGWMVLGIGYEAGKQITYHLPEKYWSECNFASTLEQAPEYDGHTSADVLERLKN